MPDRVRACAAVVPFLCDIQRAITFTAEYPYAEVADFLARHLDLTDAARNTLRYVDNALLATRITADGRRRRADGRDLPALDGLRRLQRDQRP